MVLKNTNSDFVMRIAQPLSCHGPRRCEGLQMAELVGIHSYQAAPWNKTKSPRGARTLAPNSQLKFYSHAQTEIYTRACLSKGPKKKVETPSNNLNTIFPCAEKSIRPLRSCVSQWFCLISWHRFISIRKSSRTRVRLSATATAFRWGQNVVLLLSKLMLWSRSI